MSQEIVRNSSLSAQKNGIKVVNITTQVQRNMQTTLSHMFHEPQFVGPTAELSAHYFSDIDPSYDYMLWYRHAGAADYIDVIARKDATPTDVVIGTMYAGDFCDVGRVRATVVHAAGTAVTVDNTTEKVTLAAHTLANGDRVQFAATAMPAGLVAGTWYYVVSTAANDFQVAAAYGGAAINITSNGTSVTMKSCRGFTMYLLQAKAGSPGYDVEIIAAEAGDPTL